MNRRKFMFGMAAGIAATQIPISSKWMDIGGGTIAESGDVIFDAGTKTIRYIGGNKKLAIAELYQEAKNAWYYDDEIRKYEFPILAITTEQIETQNGWSVPDGSFLKRGGLLDTKTGNRWIDFIRLGGHEDTFADFGIEDRPIIHRDASTHTMMKVTPDIEEMFIHTHNPSMQSAYASGFNRYRLKDFGIDISNYVGAVRFPYS